MRKAIEARRAKQEARAAAIERGELQVEDPREARLKAMKSGKSFLAEDSAKSAKVKSPMQEAAALVAAKPAPRMSLFGSRKGKKERL